MWNPFRKKNKVFVGDIMSADEKAKMLEVIFNKMNKHGVARYSDNHCTVMIDPTGKMFERMRGSDIQELEGNLKNPFGESR